MEQLKNIWKNHYNNSSMREGLLSWYDFDDHSEILEWNAECGALSGLLASKAEKLVCLCDNEEQKCKIEKKLNGANNASVQICGCLDENKKYDYIVAVLPFEKGVEDRGVINTIAMWKKLLKKEGKLLLVINNKLSANHMMGIRNTKSREFSKTQIKEIFCSYFKRNHFYYIYPDLVFPQCVYTDEKKPGQNLVERIMPYAKNLIETDQDNYDIYELLNKEGHLVEAVNSYLIELTDDGEAGKVLSAMMTHERESGALATKIYADRVVKCPLNNAAKTQVKRLCANLKMLKSKGLNIIPFDEMAGEMIMPYFQAPTLAEFLNELIEKDKDAFLEILDRLYADIMASSDEIIMDGNDPMSEKYGFHDWGKILKVAYIEMSPLNIFFNNGQLVYFDQEYTLEHYPAKYVMFRAISHLYCFNNNYHAQIPLEIIKKRYGLEDIWGFFEKEEVNVLAAIRGNGINKEFLEHFPLYTRYHFPPFADTHFTERKVFFENAEEKKIVCWGAGNYFDVFYHTFNQCGDVDYIVDSNPVLQGRTKYDIPVISPGELMEIKENLRVIITCSYVENVISDLNKMGIADVRTYNPSYEKYGIGYVPGSFDLFHVGHLNLIRKAKERCHYLIVGVCSDELIELYKRRRPHIKYEDRAAIVEAIAYVDKVIEVNMTNTDKIAAWKQLHYDCHFAGSDHKDHWQEERTYLASQGANMEFFDYTEGISTTIIRSELED